MVTRTERLTRLRHGIPKHILRNPANIATPTGVSRGVLHSVMNLHDEEY